MNDMLIHSTVALAIAIIFGVLGTISMKISHGFTHLKPSLYLAFFYSVSFVALTLAIENIELTTVYAVWSGVGTLLVAVIGILYFKESISFKKIVYLLLIVIGVIGIHISDFIAKF